MPKPSNRRVGTGMHGGVGGEEPRGFPLSDDPKLSTEFIFNNNGMVRT